MTQNELIEKVAMKLCDDDGVNWKAIGETKTENQRIDRRDYRKQAREIIALFQPVFDEVRELALSIRDNPTGICNYHKAADKILSLIPTAPDEPQPPPDLRGRVKMAITDEYGVFLCTEKRDDFLARLTDRILEEIGGGKDE